MSEGSVVPNEISAEEIESNWDQVIESFDEMALKEELLRGIYAYGFERPSAIQQRAILPVIKGHDVMFRARRALARRLPSPSPSSRGWTTPSGSPRFLSWNPPVS